MENHFWVHHRNWRDADCLGITEVGEKAVKDAAVRDDRAALLDLSIEKWQMVADHIEQTGRPIYDGGNHTCPLCKAGSCYSCPVYARTGHLWCINTPYTAYNDLLGHIVAAGYPPGTALAKQCSKLAAIARKEVTYLQSLQTRKEKQPCSASSSSH